VEALGNTRRRCPLFAEPNPSDLTPEQRLRELASLFATAILRLHEQDPAAFENSRESLPNRLAVRPEPSVTVHTG